MSPSGVGTCSTHHATLFQGAGTDESVLIEIMATRNNQEIRAINEAYQEGRARRDRGAPRLWAQITLYKALLQPRQSFVSGLGPWPGVVKV